MTSPAVSPISRKIGFNVVFMLAIVAMAVDAKDRIAVLVLGAASIRSGPTVHVRIWLLCTVTVVVVAALSAVAVVVRRDRVANAVVIAGVVALLFAYLSWAPDGSEVDFSNILVATVGSATPLLLGSTAGVLSERSGMINIAIEGEFLGGACAGAFFGTIWHGDVVGLLAAMVAGALIGFVLTVLVIRHGVDQIVGGIILTTLVLGVTSFLVEQTLDPNTAKFNSPVVFGAVKIPLLHEIPIIGKALFAQGAIFYIAVVVIVGVELMLRRTTLGLRIRASGENPRAAMTSGVDVRRLRYGVGTVAGALAGVGGAYFTLGSSGAFIEDMTAGLGYVALAAVIFGSWRAGRAAMAALLFGFAVSLSTSLGLLNVNINANVLLMVPYLFTIAAVAATRGAKAPAADGAPLPQV